MKKILLSFLCVFCLLFCFGCENGNYLRTASFTNITSAGSKNYAFKVVFASDERVDSRYYDIQIKADGEKKIKIGKEFEEKKEVTLSEKWASLTTLLLDEPSTETFTKGSEAVTLVYIFNVQEKTNITVRVVVGGVEENSSGKGQIITSPEEASDEFVIKAE